MRTLRGGRRNKSLGRRRAVGRKRTRRRRGGDTPPQYSLWSRRDRDMHTEHGIHMRPRLSDEELLNKMKERAVKASGHVQANPYLAGLLQDERDANVDTNVDTNKALATGAAANRSFKYMSPASIMEARRARSGTGGKSKKKRRRRRRRTRR